MSDEARTLLEHVLREPREFALLPPAQMDLAIRLLRRARLLAHVAVRMGPQPALPRAAREALASAVIAAESRARLALWELDRIAWALREDDSTAAPRVPVVAMKGAAYLLCGFGHARGRQFADVDLMVPEASLEWIERCLLERGWVGTELSAYDERYYREWTHELPPLRHEEREVEIDIHHNLVMRTARVKPDATKLLAGARAIPGSRFEVLAPPDMVIHAATHLFLSSEMDDSLRELVDLDALMRQFGGCEVGFWEELVPRARELDLSRPLAYALRYCQRHLATPVPAGTLAESARDLPSSPILRVMDRCVPLALFPPHPDGAGSPSARARLLLYVRTHWLRMPPVRLVRHLAYKFHLKHS